MQKFLTMEKTMSQGPVKREMTSDDAKRRKMTCWTILGIHLEVAGTSDAECLLLLQSSDAEWVLMMDVSGCLSQDGHKPNDLTLLWLGNA